MGWRHTEGEGKCGSEVVQEEYDTHLDRNIVTGQCARIRLYET